jgi:hypothetical protein
MTEKNTITLVIVAVIGAFGAILAACIGLIPTILPIVRPTSTALVFVPDTLTPSFTPQAETPSATAAPTDFPTLTATFQPQETPTETQTTVPTPISSSSDVDDYEGTWTTVDEEPASDKVRLVITRIEIAKTADVTANVSVCRAAEDQEVFVQPNPSVATMYAFGLAARDFVIPDFENLRWAVVVQRAGEQLVATVQEYDTNNVLLGSDTFQLKKASLLDAVGFQSCENPTETPGP